MSKRILLLTQWFDPEPTFKGLLFAKELQAMGYQVDVLTGFPNYPGGKLYPGYKMRLLQREVIDGINVTRVPLYPDHGKSALKRIFNYASFAMTSLFYALFFAKRPDVIYAYHPPLSIGIVAAVVRLFRRVPVVYDIQDMWPDTLRATGMLQNEKVLGLIGRICSWVYGCVDHIVVLSPGFKRLLCERGVPSEKIDVIYNWAEEKSLGVVGDNVYVGSLAADKFRVLFAGNMGKAQDLDCVLDAAERLALIAPKVMFVFLGGGIELPMLKAKAQEKRLSNVMFLPAVPMAQVGPYLQYADTLLVHLRKDPLFEITIPSKTQAYMAAGKPIIMAVDGDAADLVLRSGGGVSVPSGDPDALAQAVKSVAELSAAELDGMGKNAKNFYQKNLSVEVGVRKFSNVFDRVFKR